MLLINISLLSIFICITRGSYHQLFAVDCTVEGDTYPFFVEDSYIKWPEYIVCKDGNPLKVVCPVGLYYDAVSEKCRKGFKLQKRSGLCRNYLFAGQYQINLRAFEFNPTIYYLCFDNKIKFILKCPRIRDNYQLFIDNSCRIPCSQKSGNQSAARIDDYIHCSHGQYGSVQTCPNNSYFDPDLKRCTEICLRTLTIMSKPPLNTGIYWHSVANLVHMDAAGWVRREKEKYTMFDCDSSLTRFPSFHDCTFYYQCVGEDQHLSVQQCNQSLGYIYNYRKEECMTMIGGIPRSSMCAQNPCIKDQIGIVRLPQQKSHFYLCENGEVIYMARCHLNHLGYTWVLQQHDVTRCVIECNFTGLRNHPDPKYKETSGFSCRAIGAPGDYIVCEYNQIFVASKGGCVKK